MLCIRTLVVPPILNHFDVEAGDCASTKIASSDKVVKRNWMSFYKGVGMEIGQSLFSLA